MTKYERSESIFLPDYSAASKERFFQLLRQNYRVLTAEDMQELNNGQQQFTIAWFDYGLDEQKFGDRIQGVQVSVNEEAFLIAGDHRDLIPITVEHEIVEGWVNLKFSKRNKGKVERAAQGVGHHVALRAEYRLAHQMGVADRYYKLTQRWAKYLEPEAASHFLTENFEAYHYTKKSILYLR